jgi:nitrogen fixation protein
MAYRERQKISQMTPKGANLEATDLIEISELQSGTYVTKSITGQEIIDSVSASSSWGTITGDINTQTDLQNEFDTKFDNPTGTSAEYIDGTGSLQTFPTIPVVSGFIPYTGANQNANLGEYELKAGQLSLDTSPTGTAAVGTTQWNDSIGSSQTTLKGGTVILKNGVDLVARIVNKVTPNATLTKANYTAVKVSGAQGQRLAVDYAQANSDLNSADTIGLVTETIATNQEGFIITVGQIEDINTTGSLQSETWADGDVLYLSPTTPGKLTNIKPAGATGHIVVIGYVEYAHAIHGKIYVKIMNGWELDELHNVYINAGTLANNDALIYESSTQLWKNKTIPTALGYTPVTNARTITINGSTQDLTANRTWTIATGLTYFTEAQNTTAPNASTPVDSLTAVSAAVNADFAILPKGNGAILASIPDNTTVGGNKRGTNAVDLQMIRLTNAAVASGRNSVISGGYYNTASGQESSVGGGYENRATATQSRVGGGNQNLASADYATVGGGTSNTASGPRATVAGGSSCTATNYAASTLGGFGNVSTNNYASNLGGISNSASGEGSSVLGGTSNVASGTYSLVGGASSVANSSYSRAFGWGATTNGVLYRDVYGSRHTAVGDSQCSTFIMRTRTSDAMLTTFTSDGTGAASNNQIVLSNNSAFRFKGTIIAKQTATTNAAAWDIDGLIVRGANAAATTLLISNVTLVQNTPAWGTPTLSTDTTQGSLKIQIQGAAATNIQWVANIETTEVIY